MPLATCATPGSDEVGASRTETRPISVALSTLAFTLLLIGAAGCRVPATGGRRVQISGVVVSTTTDPRRIELAHDGIEGVMPAMTMMLPVGGPVTRVAPGDHVSATLVIDAGASHLDAITVTAHAEGPLLALPPVLPSPRPGSELPDVSLRDQDGRVLDTRQFRGDVVLVAFVYTGCPLPEYCPTTMRRIDALKRALETQPAVWTHVRVLTVTLDPEHDGPAELRAYGERFISGSRKFSRWSLASGDAADIQRLAHYFGVTVGMTGGTLAHSLATAVIGADGRLRQIFNTNDWRIDDVARAVTEAVEASPQHHDLASGR